MQTLLPGSLLSFWVVPSLDTSQRGYYCLCVYLTAPRGSASGSRCLGFTHVLPQEPESLKLHLGDEQRKSLVGPDVKMGQGQSQTSQEHARQPAQETEDGFLFYWAGDKSVLWWD